MNTLVLLLISLLAFGIIVVLMAVGVILRGRCIRGSCGGQAIYDADGELLNCDTCPVRKEHEQELARGTGGTRVSASK